MVNTQLLAVYWLPKQLCVYFFTPEPTSLAGRASRSPSARGGPICQQGKLLEAISHFTPFPHYWTAWSSPGLAGVGP